MNSNVCDKRAGTHWKPINGVLYQPNRFAITYEFNEHFYFDDTKKENKIDRMKMERV